METDPSPTPTNGDPEGSTPTEGAVLGPMSVTEIRTFLDGWTRARLGSAIARVRFRSGRIDAVWGVELADGRAVVVKAHRPPYDVAAIRAAHEAQRTLVEAGFPCAAPLAGPEEVDGRLLTAESLIEGAPVDGRGSAGRLLLAAGLARHLELLGHRTDLVAAAGPGPSWCHYQAGPWPVPHDTLVDFRTTPPGSEWLDAFGRRAADQILAHRDAGAVVLGHADWYAGNALVADGALAGTFDWELVADSEPVIAGFAAACYAASATAGGGLSTPEEAAAFLRDYDRQRAEPLDAAQRRTAAGATAWILAFNARWQVGLVDHGLDDQTVVALVRERGDDYLDLSW